MATWFARYGGKRGFIAHCKCMAKYHFGGYRQYHQLEFGRVVRLVFVCKGNICRSPYAEARVQMAGYRLRISSFGLHASHREPANEQAIRTAKSRGVDLSGHRTRTVGDLHIDQSDLLVAMDPTQARALEPYRHAHNAQVTLLGLWGEDVLPIIADPYGHDSVVFEMCFVNIDAAVRGLCARITNEQPW